MSKPMSEIWTNFLSSGPFIPHGHCYLWKTDLVLLHLLSDALIAIAYYSIPTTLFYFVRKRKDLPFHWIFLLFSVFIVACGTTHLIEIWTLWHPTYWVSGSVKAITAILSLLTAVKLVPLVPQALALKSPAQLELVNQELQIQIAQRLSIEEDLRTYQNHLEELVAVRTNEITNTNEQLRQEIAERQRVLEALRQSEERYRYLTEAIPQLIWTTNAEGKCDYFNYKWSEYTGLTLEQSLDSGWLLALHPDDVQPAYEVWISAVKSGTLYENEYRFKRASDGSYRWQLARGLPLKDEQGHVVKWFGTCTDIHEQKQIQQERANLLELEQAARAKAETANRIKDEFFAVLSHELRTPLHAILGWSKLLQNPRIDQTKAAQALSTIERNAKLQAQLIDDLLDISKILQGKLTLNITNVNLEPIILSALETISLAAETKSIQVNTVFEPHVGQVMGDSTRLQQVIWNLLSNAVKFTPHGGLVEVRLSAEGSGEWGVGSGEEGVGSGEERSLAPAYAQITVRDTGKGISAEFLPYAFDYFRQADSSTTRKFGGLGLGLAIVRNIVEIHGGTVKAESLGEDQGATFVVRLPLLLNTGVGEQELDTGTRGHGDTQNGSKQISGSSPSDAVSMLEGLKVLVVDDDADSRNFVAFVLEQEGAEVIMVSSAFEALQALAQSKPDVLISDISMPDMDGYALIRQVRTWTPEQGGQIPAIALTAFARDYDQQQALLSGFGMHLPKPLNSSELVAAVLNLIAVVNDSNRSGGYEVNRV